MNLGDQIKSVDLAALVESAGVELRQRGNKFVGLCPIHGEDNPSFYVFPDNHFKCFGCGEYGDAVDFLRLLYGYDFLEALKHLGINGQLTLQQHREIKRKNKLNAERIQRERDLIHTLSILIRAARKCGKNVDLLPAWEFYHDVLARGSREDKDEILEGLKDFATITRTYLFEPDFNYRGLLRESYPQTKEPTFETAARLTLQDFNAAELIKMDIPEPKWAVPEILPERLNILAGKP